MSLPKINAPRYKTTLPDSKVEVEYRPYLVREEQLMVVVADDSDGDIITTMNQVLASCTFGKVDIETLSAIDTEWLLLKIRIKAKGDKTEVSLECKNEVDGVECNTINTVDVKLSEAIVIENNNVSDVISLTDTCGVKMFRMNLDTQLTLAEEDESVRDFKIVLNSVDQIFFGDEVYLAKDIGEEAVENWLGDLTGTQLDQLIEYVHNAPRIVIDAKFHCMKCGYEEDIKIAGIDSFFE